MGKETDHGKIGIRARGQDIKALSEALGFDLPIEPCRSCAGSDAVALWLGPDEWLLVLALDRVPERIASLRHALDGRHVALVDLSDSTTTIRIAGPRARDVLAKGCPLDLHPRAFGKGAVAQSLIGKVDVILHQIAAEEDDGGPAYALHVRRSFADHLWRFLEDGAIEWGFELSGDS